MKLIVVAGARPNFMKIAPIVRALKARGHRALIVHTGQHYDSYMSDQFFKDLDIPAPDYSLGVGAGSHAEQTARVMLGFDPILVEEKPDWVLVVGDVNSTVAAALVTSKRRVELGCRLAHVEAGLRSGDWRMPEEVNRVVTDSLSDLLLTHSPEALDALIAEGVPRKRIVAVGNVMIDSLFSALEREPHEGSHPDGNYVPAGFGLVTLHRPSNVDDPERLQLLLNALGEIATEVPLVWPVHPRARKQLAALNYQPPASVHLMTPLGYPEMVRLQNSARVVITDSGGLQEETTALGIPCVTLRQSTERPVTVTEGTNTMIPWPLTHQSIVSTVLSAAARGRTTGSRAGIPAGWDGRAAERIVSALETADPADAQCARQDTKAS